MISKSTLELIKLLENIIQQSDSSEKKRNMQESIKNVIENYTFSVQLHHAQLLSKIPQQSALFYNNCNYLGNWVLTNKDLDYSDMGNVVHELKREGVEFFDCQVAKQKIQLLDILKDFGEFHALAN
jgi:Centromere/kinetochore Zw10